jgi:hypothetical protein
MFPNDPFARDAPIEPQEPRSNGLGVAGFVVSLVGLFTCGCLSVVGLGLSSFALARKPRGFAIAGFIIGLFGLLELLAVGVFVLVYGGLIIGPAVEDGHKVSIEIKTYQQNHNGAMPTSWADLPAMSGGIKDRWGHPYHYKLLSDGKRVELTSDGPDGRPGTDDDVYVLIEGDNVAAHVGRMPPFLTPR